MVTFFFIYLYLPAVKQLTVLLLSSASDEIFSGFFAGMRMYDSVPTMSRMGMAGPAGPAGGAAPPPIQTVRTFFPETWIWDLVEVG